MIEELFRAPERFSFFQAVRLLERRAFHRRRAKNLPPPDPVGMAPDADRESVRFRASLDLRFPGAALTAATEGVDGKPPELTVAFIGLAGATGPLPLHYAALAQPRRGTRRGPLHNLLDLFNHRLISLFYAAWAKYRLPIGYEQHAGRLTDDVSTLLRALVGIGTKGLEGRLAFSDEVVLHYGGMFARQVRSAVGLEQILAEQLGVPVKIEQFVGAWLDIPRQEQSRLSCLSTDTGRYAQLGVDALIGSRTWDIEGNIRIDIGPVDRAMFRRLLPGGADIARITDLVRLYLPLHLRFTICPILRQADIPKIQLRADADAPRLGFESWLHALPMPTDARDVNFDPETIGLMAGQALPGPSRSSRSL